MIDFKPINISDRSWIRESIKYKTNIPCEYSFGNLFTYSAKYNIFVSNHNNVFLSKIDCGDIDVYSYPVGNGDIKQALKDLIEYINSLNRQAILYGLNKTEAEFFNDLYRDKYIAKESRDSFDYCYNFDDLSQLAGKKYQPKRNHYSYFIKNNNWTYEKICEDNIQQCLDMSKKWLDEYIGDKEDLIKEYAIICKAFENYNELNYVGALIRIDGNVVAYTMGEELDKDHFCVHIEKAFPSIRGAYQAINRMFVTNELSSYKFINREDDVGLEGLRKAKLSYHPAYFEEKYEVVIK